MWESTPQKPSRDLPIIPSSRRKMLPLQTSSDLRRTPNPRLLPAFAPRPTTALAPHLAVAFAPRLSAAWLGVPLRLGSTSLRDLARRPTAALAPHLAVALAPRPAAAWLGLSQQPSLTE